MAKVFIWTIVVAAAVVGLGWLFHRICTRLEEAGYLYYRKKERPAGGSAMGAFQELDKLTNPSIEHVIEAQDTEKISREDVGGE